MFFFSCIAFASLIRIFERPYYEFNFPDDEFYYFKSYFSSLWYIMITMTSVGFGNIVAVTPIGRLVTILAGFMGAIFLAMMVTLVTEWLHLDDKQALCMHKVKDQENCGRSIVAALKYNAARQKRYRLLMNNDTDEYCPTLQDLNRLKANMYRLTRIHADCPEKRHHLEVARQEKRLDTLQDQVIKLQDRFDFFIML